MSYDIRLVADLGGPAPVHINVYSDEDGFNWGHTGWLSPTYNVAPMFELALGHSIREFDGKRAGDTIEALIGGAAKMMREPAAFEKLNPKNGWGSTHTARDTMRIMVAWAQRAPDAVWCI